MTLHLLNEAVKLLLEADIKFFSYSGMKFIVRGTAHLKDEREDDDCEEKSLKSCSCKRAVKKNKNGVAIDDDGNELNVKDKQDRKKTIKLDHCDDCKCDGQATDCKSEVINNQCKVTARLDDECNDYERGNTLKGQGDRTSIAVEASIKALIKEHSLDKVLNACKGSGNIVACGIEIEEYKKIQLTNHKRTAKGQFTKGHTTFILDLYKDPKSQNNIIVKIVTIYPIDSRPQKPTGKLYARTTIK